MMNDVLEKTNKKIESIALEVVMLDVEDIPALGTLVNCLGVLEEDSKEIDQTAFSELIQAIKSYIEKYKNALVELIKQGKKIQL